MDGDRRQSHDRQNHAVDRARPQRGYSGHQRQPDRRSSGQAGEQRSQSGSGGGATLGGRETTVDFGQTGEAGLGRTGDEQLRGAAENLERFRGELASGSGNPTFGVVSDFDREDRHDEARVFSLPASVSVAASGLYYARYPPRRKGPP